MASTPRFTLVTGAAFHVPKSLAELERDAVSYYASLYNLERRDVPVEQAEEIIDATTLIPLLKNLVVDQPHSDLEDVSGDMSAIDEWLKEANRRHDECLSAARRTIAHLLEQDEWMKMVVEIPAVDEKIISQDGACELARCHGETRLVTIAMQTNIDRSYLDISLMETKFEAARKDCWSLIGKSGPRHGWRSLRSRLKEIQAQMDGVTKLQDIMERQKSQLEVYHPTRTAFEAKVLGVVTTAELVQHSGMSLLQDPTQMCKLMRDEAERMSEECRVVHSYECKDDFAAFTEEIEGQLRKIQEDIADWQVASMEVQVQFAHDLLNSKSVMVEKDSMMERFQTAVDNAKILGDNVRIKSEVLKESNNDIMRDYLVVNENMTAYRENFKLAKDIHNVVRDTHAEASQITNYFPNLVAKWEETTNNVNNALLRKRYDRRKEINREIKKDKVELRAQFELIKKSYPTVREAVETKAAQIRKIWANGGYDYRNLTEETREEITDARDEIYMSLQEYWDVKKNINLLMDDLTEKLRDYSEYMGVAPGKLPTRKAADDYKNQTPPIYWCSKKAQARAGLVVDAGIQSIQIGAGLQLEVQVGAGLQGGVRLTCAATGDEIVAASRGEEAPSNPGSRSVCAREAATANGKKSRRNKKTTSSSATTTTTTTRLSGQASVESDRRSTSPSRQCAFPDCPAVNLQKSALRQCKKCRDRNSSPRSYYCGTDCRDADWTLQHRQFHRDERN